MRPRLGRSVRLRLAPYFLLLALPLLAGVWAFGNFAAANARERADTRLEATLGAATVAYSGRIGAAETRARALARSPRVQRAIARRRRGILIRLARRHPNVAFFTRTRRLAGRIPLDAPRRAVAIVAGGRSIGRVVAAAPLDDTALARIGAAAGLPAGDRLVAVSRGRIVAGGAPGTRISLPGRGTGDARVRAARYRAATARVVRDRDLRVAVLAPHARFAASASRARRRVLLAGLAVLAGVALAAYALAPVFARTRITRQQRAQAAHVLSHVGDGVFLVDRGGEIKFWNPAAEAITGVDAPAVLGRRPADLFRRWNDHAPVPAPARPGERPGRADAETALYEVNGRELWLSISAVEAPGGTIYAFRDLTEELRLEEARSDFVATVSHELRTPLSSIHGAAHTLRDREPDLSKATRRQLHEIVFEQSARLSHLVDQILLANQLSSGSLHVEKRDFDPVQVARETVKGIRPALPAKIELELRTPRSLPTVVGDPERTRQVLANLVENAAKYSPRGGRVEVALAQSDGSVRFSVRDEGLGIPAHEQKRIFDRFYRLDPSMSRGVGGSGLGLYICRELVSLMNGRLRVSSQPGMGSTFSFELPTAADMPEG